MRENSFAKGYQAAKKGGAIGPDAAERFAKRVINKTTSNSGADSKPAPVKQKPAKEPAIKQKPKATVAAELPTGVSAGKYVQIRKGDVIFYKSSTGSEGDGSVTKVAGDDQVQIKQGGNLVTVKSKDIAKVNDQDWKLKEQISKDTIMKKQVKEGLADLAQRAEHDHEVQMARADLYKIAKYAIKLHEMLKGVSEEQGLEGWQQAKITKASDYISAVYHNLDYDMKFNGAGELGEGKSPHKKGSKAYKKQMAAKHASMAESNDPYKTTLAKRLEEKFKK